MDPIDRFAAEARSYRRWLYCGTDKKEEFVRNALHHVTHVVAAATDLPLVSMNELHTEEKVDVTRSMKLRLRKKRLHPNERMPFDHYSMVFNPLEVPPEEPIFASLNDDLWDINSDLCCGLAEYNFGNRMRAAWVWESKFRFHWGRHATSATVALRAWLEDNAKD